jgi:hypothetical protein
LSSFATGVFCLEVDIGDILVGTNTGGFQSLRGELFIFVGDEVNAEGEVVDVGLLTSQIEDTDLGVGNTTVEPGLGVGLDRETY